MRESDRHPYCLKKLQRGSANISVARLTVVRVRDPFIMKLMMRANGRNVKEKSHHGV